MELLFSKGKSSNAYPLKLVYLETPVDLMYSAQAMFVVPKRNHKRAHDRNKLKRRVRESYRLIKNSLYEELEQKEERLLLAFIYVSKKQEDYSVIQKSMTKLISNLTK